MRVGFWLALTSILAFVSGCNDTNGEDAPGEDDPPTPVPDPGNGTVDPPLPTPDEVPVLASANECMGADVSGESAYGLEPQPTPPGWDGTNPTTRSGLMLLECAKLNWGPFARPVQMLLEYHSAFVSPPACGQGGDPDVEVIRLVSKWWFNDTEVVDWMAATYPGMPVAAVTFSRTIQAGPMEEQTFRWTPSGAGESSITLRRTMEPPADFVDGYRFFWWNETGVAHADFIARFTSTSGVGPVAVRELHDPMVNDANPTDTSPGTALIHEPSEIEISVRRFADFRCEEELP